MKSRPRLHLSASSSSLKMKFFFPSHPKVTAWRYKNPLRLFCRERASRKGQREDVRRPVLSSHTTVLPPTQPAITDPLIRFAARGGGDTPIFYSDDPERSKPGRDIGTPLRTGGWNNSDHSWQQRMSGEYTHMWHGAQMSFHLRRTLKGDRLHPSCQADRLAVGKDSGSGCAQKPICV